MTHTGGPAHLPIWHTALVLGAASLLSMTLFSMTSQALAFPVAPSTLSYSASTSNPTPASQTVTFSMKSLVPRAWNASGDQAWMRISPASGTITREKDQILIQVNATGMASGTYRGTIRIAIADKNNKTQAASVPVTLVVAGSTTGGGASVVPTIQLNPTMLNFTAVAGGPPPLAKPVMLSNPTGGTLTWTMTEPAAWLALNVSNGTTTSETDSISASVSTTGLAAGSYSTAITVTATGSSNSPQTIPVTLTLTAPSTTGTATLTWDANVETNLAGYRVYMGTQTGVYGTPIGVGNTTAYTVGNLTGGRTYYFAVTAVDHDGNESLYSAEVMKAIY